jgi:hypothetical protein
MSRHGEHSAGRGTHPSGRVAVLGAVVALLVVVPTARTGDATARIHDAGATSSPSTVPTPAPAPVHPVGGPLTRRPAAPRVSAGAVPQVLEVPALGVSAPVLPIQVSGDGVLVPPGDPQELGWWAGGARAGSGRGSVLITGHTVHTGGGAFDDLDRLPPGATVRVRTGHAVLRYVVTDVHVYPKQTLADHAAQLFSQTVPERLVLVTCEGWNGTGYDANAVVLAVPVR